ncbi:hypothetical protein PROPEN_02744 [Proteus penneri ATCC 35198]|nr:hypothetical protein PROPEN_02744 [Proteus penneri ATCC 35198]
MRNMHKICQGRTVIIIAHRLSTVKKRGSYYSHGKRTNYRTRQTQGTSL